MTMLALLKFAISWRGGHVPPRRQDRVGGTPLGIGCNCKPCTPPVVLRRLLEFSGSSQMRV